MGNGQISRLSRPVKKKIVSAAKAAIANRKKMMKVPTVIHYHHSSGKGKNKKPKPKHVYFSGTLTDWRTVEMGVFMEKGGDVEYYAIVDTSPGRYWI